MDVANTLAYYDTSTITVVKSFIVQSPAQIIYPARLASQGVLIRILLLG